MCKVPQEVIFTYTSPLCISHSHCSLIRKKKKREKWILLILGWPKSSFGFSVRWYEWNFWPTQYVVQLGQEINFSPLFSPGHPNIYKPTIILEFSLKILFHQLHPSLASIAPHIYWGGISTPQLLYLGWLSWLIWRSSSIIWYNRDWALSQMSMDSKERNPDFRLWILPTRCSWQISLQSLCKYLYFKFNSVKSKGWNRWLIHLFKQQTYTEHLVYVKLFVSH